MKIRQATSLLLILAIMSGCVPIVPTLVTRQPDPVPAASPAQLTPSPIPDSLPCEQNCFYVDNLDGRDTNSGTSPDRPWQTLARVHAETFAPGAVIHFRRGSTFRGGLVLDDSGTESAPIRLTAYGDGPAPIFENPEANFGRAVSLYANWVIVENLLIRDAMEAGVYIADGAFFNLIQNNEITAVGEGLKVHGSYNRIIHNHIHDLRMVVNTPGGDDDFGAVGVWLFAGENEVAYNRIVNCKAASYDYGADGGAVEIWANPGTSVDNNFIHHNFAQANKGFAEFGGRSGASRGTVIAYNVMIDNDRVISIHMGGTFALDVQGLRFENNTVVDTRPESTFTAFYFSSGSPTPQTLTLRNNIFWLGNYQKFTLLAANGFAHSHNLYYFDNPDTLLNLELGEGEQVGNPFFNNLPAFDLTLAPASPAIDAGLDLGYATDFDGNPVPFGPAPDLGAYEFSVP